MYLIKPKNPMSDSFIFDGIVAHEDEESAKRLFIENIERVLAENKEPPLPPIDPSMLLAGEIKQQPERPEIVYYDFVRDHLTEWAER